MFPWSSWHTLVPLVLGILGIIAFVLFELLISKEPLIPLRIFKYRNAWINYTGSLIQGIILWCLLYYMPLYYEAVKGYTPLIVGVACFPETFTVTPASIIVGVVASKTGRYRWAIWSGWFLSVLGMGLLCLLSPDTSIPAWIFLNLVAGLGLGLLFSSMNLAIQSATPQKDVAFAAAMYIFMRSLGQGIGVAIGGIIFENQFAVKLSSFPSLMTNVTDLAQDASGLVQVIKAMPDTSPEREMIVSAYADALKIVWAVMAALAFIAMVMSAGIEGLSLDIEHTAEQGLRSAEKADNRGENVQDLGKETRNSSSERHD